MKKLPAIIVLAGFLVSCTKQDVKQPDTVDKRA